MFEAIQKCIDGLEIMIDGGEPTVPQARAELATVRELFEAAELCDCANSVVETRLSKAVGACKIVSIAKGTSP